MQIRLGIGALAGANRTDWTGTAESGLAQGLLEIKERLGAEILRVVGSWDRDRAWEIDGSLSSRAWLTHHAATSDSCAQCLVNNARLVDQHNGIAVALADGDITTPHVEAIGNVMSRDRQPLLDEHQDTLVDQAKKLPVGEFATLMRRWAALADDQLAKDTFTQKWERRRLHISTALDGWVTDDFLVDPVAGETLTNVLDHIAPPDPVDAPEQPRPLSQRRADALIDLANWYRNRNKPGGNPPNINVTIDIATLVGESPNIATTRCDIDGAGPITRAVLDQLCCDATFTKFITSGPSVILDMGRTARHATPTQRKAATIRDRHCRFPSCNRKPQWCDIHHIAGWADSLGNTDMNNLILLCRRHHTLIHNTKWTINQTPNGEVEFNHPTRAP